MGLVTNILKAANKERVRFRGSTSTDGGRPGRIHCVLESSIPCSDPSNWWFLGWEGLIRHREGCWSVPTIWSHARGAQNSWPWRDSKIRADSAARRRMWSNSSYQVCDTQSSGSIKRKQASKGAWKEYDAWVHCSKQCEEGTGILVRRISYH